MTAQDTRRVGAWVVAVSIGGTVLLGVGAFWLSFTALADLAVRAGTPTELAWVWALIVDGVIVIATMSVVALSPHGVRATRYPWVLLGGAALVSVSANIAHALVAADDGVPGLLAGLVASVPPIVLLAVTHLTVELSRYHRRSPTTPASTPLLTPGTTVSTHVPKEERPTGAATDQSESDAGERASARAASPPSGTRDVEIANAELREQATALHREGLSNRRIAEQVGVHPSTIGRWLKSASPHAHDNTTNRKDE